MSRIYMLDESDIKNLESGKLKSSDVTIPQNRCLITWSGEDVNIMLKEHFGINNADEIFNDDLLDRVCHLLSDYEYSMDIEEAVDLALSENKAA